MRQITKNILSRYSKLDLENILLNKDSKNQAILSDLDGTIHRGLWPAVLHGASYADLSILLSFYLKLPQLKKHVTCSNYILREYRHMIHNGHQQGLIENVMTRYYCNNLLPGLDMRQLNKAARWLPKLAYKDSKKSLTEMGKKSEITIISKTINPVMASYSNSLLKEGLKINYKCNELITEGYEICGLQTPGILSASDKYWAGADCLKNKERTAIFGNTSEDLAMHKAAKKLGIESIMIAVHPRDKQLEEEADVIMNSWSELYSEIMAPRRFELPISGS